MANVLASRLKELEVDGLVVREAWTGSDRSVFYRATSRAEELRAALDALGRWVLPGCGKHTRARSSPMPRWSVPCVSSAKAEGARRRVVAR